MAKKPADKGSDESVRRLEAIGCERRRDEGAMKNSDELMRIQFNMVRDMIFIHRFFLEGIPEPFMEVNDCACGLLGYSKEEMLALTPIDIISGSDVEDVPDEAELLNTRQQLLFEKTLITKSGERIPVEINSSIYKCGDQAYAISIARDITERIQREEALRESEKKFRTLVENTIDWVWQVDPEGVFTYASPGVERIIGYTPGELLGKTPFALMSAREARRVGDIFSRIAAKRERIIALENTLLHKDGHPVVFETNATPLFDKEGTFRGYFGTCRDITTRKQYELSLQRIQKLDAVGTLAGGIAHDFNNLLGIITGNVSLALSRIEKDDALFEMLSDVQRGAVRARDLTQQLLTFARGGEPIKKPTDLNRLIRESASFATRGAKARCEFDLANDLWIVEVDEGQTSQVIGNLLINANQAMPDGGVITIRTENAVNAADSGLPLPEGRYVRCIIEDRGTGISEKFLSRIFDPYFTTKQERSGLGLSTAYSIIKKHDGHISVRSELDKGTTFYIFLPAVTEERNEIERTGGVSHRGGGRILIMDDQESILRMVGRMLDDMGYETAFALNGSQAVEMFREAYRSRKSFKLIILDLTVPGGMGGIDTISEILKIDPKAKAVVSSGYSNDPVMSNYLYYGFCGVIPKPYTKDQIAELLNEILGETD